MGLREEALKKGAEVGTARHKGRREVWTPIPPYLVFAREPFSRFIRYRFVNAITKFDTSRLIMLMLTQVFLACNVEDRCRRVFLVAWAKPAHLGLSRVQVRKSYYRGPPCIFDFYQ